MIITIVVGKGFWKFQHPFTKISAESEKETYLNITKTISDKPRREEYTRGKDKPCNEWWRKMQNLLQKSSPLITSLSTPYKDTLKMDQILKCNI